MKQKFKMIIAAVLACTLASAIMAVAAPGDDSDPLVTLSYITDVLLPDIDSRIDKKVSTSVNEAVSGLDVSTPSGETASESFTLVNIKPGYKIIGAEGTEFVLRAGKGSIVATSQGGVADLTSGSDLANGLDAPLNHHLLIPRSDSRGMTFTTDAIVLVKGTYTVSKN